LYQWEDAVAVRSTEEALRIVWSPAEEQQEEI
jgi:hypothetical protein